MTQDESLLPVRSGRELDTSLADIAQEKRYGKYGRYGNQRETNLREYLYIILKRKWLILSLVLVITSLVTIQAYREPSIYQGSTTIRIEPKPQNILQSGGLVINQNDPNFWGTQLRLLQNPALARQVIATLDLQNNPDFLGGQANTSVFSSLKRIFSRERSAAAPAQGQNVEAEPVSEREMRDKQFTPEEAARLEPYEDAIIGGETIVPIEKTNLITINFTHTKPELAQRIANTLADVFVQNNLERQEMGTGKAAVAVSQEIAKYQIQVKDQRNLLFNFAKNNNLPLTPGTTNLALDRERTYSSQLLEAENQSRNLKAAYEAAKASDDPLTNPEVQKDELIRKLREKLSDLQDKRDALLQIYTKEWPEVKKVEAQIRSTEAELTRAPAQILTSMKKRYDAAEAQAKSLMVAYSRSMANYGPNEAEIDLAAMSSNGD